MQTAPIPSNEKERLEAVHRLAILDTEPEPRFDALTKEAVEKLKVPMSMVSILDSNREWFKSCVGWEKTEGSRDVSFCGHALLARDLFIIEDTLKDERFADNPMVVGEPFIRFYAGVALFDLDTKQPIGVFCVKDKKPREFSLDEITILIDLANRAEKELNTKQNS
jgi:GAF domain-containing protein